MGRVRGNSINLGAVDGSGTPLEMTPDQRATHLYICGSTGTGKSKMLEHLLRQDIAQWHENKCGLLLLDPHGSLYDSLMKYPDRCKRHPVRVPPKARSKFQSRILIEEFPSKCQKAPAFHKLVGKAVCLASTARGRILARAP